MAHKLLRQIPLFQSLSEEDLDRIDSTVEIISIAKGQELFHEGDEGNWAFIIKDGVLEIIKESNGREVLLALRDEGTIIGEMALLESLPRTATVRARTDTTLFAIQKDEFDRLLHSSPTAMQSMFQTIQKRLRENQAQLRQSEKMAQLGTLTAGIAHELNNPAAAVKRSAGTLFEAIKKLDVAYENISQFGFEEQQWSILHKLVEKIYQSSQSPPELDALTRSDKEEKIEFWLEDRGIEDAWQIAPNLVNLQFDEKELISLAQDFPVEKMKCVIEWLNATYDVYSLLNELSQGATRISSIVKSLKSYAYLDQAPVQSVDINQGLDDTLTIMQSKLKKGINVKRVYDPDLPQIMGYGSELNQVFTNLIDNAADALADQADAQLIIRTRKEANWVFVEIEDNGPGIPKEALPNIFDAFFTTKPPGKGTGLGLNISYNIVVQKHRGDIKITSMPGKTCFEVILPIEFKE